MKSVEHNEVMRAMSVAGKSIRLKLKAIYGTPEAVEKAVRAKAQNKAELEHWGIVSSKEAFSFEDVPPPLRENAIISVACAMLVWEHEQQRAA